MSRQRHGAANSTAVSNAALPESSLQWNEMNRVITGPFVAPPLGAGDPAGTLLRRVELTEAVLTSTAYAGSLRLPQHAHTSAFLLFVRHGTFVEQQGRWSEYYDRSS